MAFQIARNGQILGWFELYQAEQALLAGHICPADYVWYPGLPEWLPLSSVPELQNAIRQLQARSSTPSNPTQSNAYFLADNHQPYLFVQLAEALQASQLQGNTPVYSMQAQAWTTFAALPEFTPYLPRPAQTATAQPTQVPQPRTRQVTTRSCGVCGGTGKSGVCPNCRGTGSERTWIDTPYTGISPIDEKIKNYANKNCSMCAGTGATVCSRCGGSGRETVLA